MEVIEISRPSSRVLAKMKKGQPCRICEGSGLKIMVERKRIKPIYRAFRKGKAHTLMLGPIEIEENMGRGLFDDIRRGFEDVGRQLKPVAEKVGEALTPIAQELGDQALDKFAEVAPELGSKALTALALYSGNPALIPVAEKVGRMGGQQLGNLARDEGKKAIQKTRRGSSAPSPTTPMTPMASPTTSMATTPGKDLAEYTLDELTQEIARRQGGYSTPLDRSGNTQTRDPRVRAVGSGLYAQGRVRGRGMSLVQGKNTLLEGSPKPDPYSANFIMASHMPPAYAQLMRS
jgi:hypothetical protein